MYTCVCRPLVDALRSAGDVVLSIVAEQDEEVVGHVLFSRLKIHTEGGGVIPAVALAPMAVMPERQRQGIGSALLRAALEECRRVRECIVIVVGHTHFYPLYPRFGFSHEST